MVDQYTAVNRLKESEKFSLGADLYIDHAVLMVATPTSILHCRASYWLFLHVEQSLQ